jgi:hypothetical protein
METVEHLRKQFIAKFPMAAEYSTLQIAFSLERAPLSYYLNNENIVTGK